MYTRRETAVHRSGAATAAPPFCTGGSTPAETASAFYLFVPLARPAPYTLTTIDLHTHTRKMHIGAAREEARDAERAKWVGRPEDGRCRWSVHITASEWLQWPLWCASRPPVTAWRASCHHVSTRTARARKGSSATRCQRIGGLQFNILSRFSSCWSTST